MTRAVYYAYSTPSDYLCPLSDVAYVQDKWTNSIAQSAKRRLLQLAQYRQKVHSTIRGQARAICRPGPYATTRHEISRQDHASKI
jgi:hypothetical protein